mmetsp:Transcript_15622/g.24297  ORF Transcript_15622/g.24297 Transcript_15622/m.24297 type:complete len:214 (-) Transcript_15622:1232-1873(-)
MHNPVLLILMPISKMQLMVLSMTILSRSLCNWKPHTTWQQQDARPSWKFHSAPMAMIAAPSYAFLALVSIAFLLVMHAKQIKIAANGPGVQTEFVSKRQAAVPAACQAHLHLIFLLQIQVCFRPTSLPLCLVLRHRYCQVKARQACPVSNHHQARQTGRAPFQVFNLALCQPQCPVQSLQFRYVQNITIDCLLLRNGIKPVRFNHTIMFRVVE